MTRASHKVHDHLSVISPCGDTEMEVRQPKFRYLILPWEVETVNGQKEALSLS